MGASENDRVVQGRLGLRSGKELFAMCRMKLTARDERRESEAAYVYLCFARAICPTGGLRCRASHSLLARLFDRAEEGSRLTRHCMIDGEESYSHATRREVAPHGHYKRFLECCEWSKPRPPHLFVGPAARPGHDETMSS
jgi:hypothetical protein